MCFVCFYLPALTKEISLPVPCSTTYEEEVKNKIRLDINVCLSYQALNDPGEIRLEVCVVVFVFGFIVSVTL